MRTPAVPAHPAQFSFAAPEGTQLEPDVPVPSPDGTRIAFSARNAAGQTMVWIRHVGSTASQPVAGTEGTTGSVFWSPDGRWLGFFAEGTLKKVEPSGGPALNISRIQNNLGATWNRDNVIIVAPVNRTVLHRVPAGGGTPEPITSLNADRRENSHRWPHFLPDSRHFLFFAGGAPDTQGVLVGCGRSGADDVDARRLGRGIRSRPRAVCAGVDAHSSTIRSVGPRPRWRPGSPWRRRSCCRRACGLACGPAPPSPHLPPGSSPIGWKAAAGGELTWFDRSGKPVGVLSDADDQNLVDPELSPDGRRVLVSRTVERNTDVWLLDGGRLARLTTDPLDNEFPVWSPDGGHVAFVSTRNGQLGLYEIASGGAGPEKLLLESPVPKVLTDWSPDGRFLLYQSPIPNKGPDIFALALTPADTSFVVLDFGHAGNLWTVFP